MFMKMVDRELKMKPAAEDDEVEDEEESMDMRHRHYQIFYGCKDRKFHCSAAAAAAAATTATSDAAAGDAK